MVVGLPRQQPRQSPRPPPQHPWRGAPPPTRRPGPPPRPLPTPPRPPRSGSGGGWPPWRGWPRRASAQGAERPLAASEDGCDSGCRPLAGASTSKQRRAPRNTTRTSAARAKRWSGWTNGRRRQVMRRRVGGWAGVRAHPRHRQPLNKGNRRNHCPPAGGQPAATAVGGALLCGQAQRAASATSARGPRHRHRSRRHCAATAHRRGTLAHARPEPVAGRYLAGGDTTMSASSMYANGGTQAMGGVRHRQPAVASAAAGHGTRGARRAQRVRRRRSVAARWRRGRVIELHAG